MPLNRITEQIDDRENDAKQNDMLHNEAQNANRQEDSIHFNVAFLMGSSQTVPQTKKTL
jgi:hypothetical protein